MKISFTAASKKSVKRMQKMYSPQIVSAHNDGHDWKDEKNMISEYTVLDLETTGLNPKRDRIIEIGAARVRKGQIIDQYSTLVNPERMLTEQTIEITGIRQEELEQAPAIKQVLPDILSFIGQDVLLGHSILFDFSFLKRAAVNEGCPFVHEGIDTLKMARRYLPELESRNLGFLCNYYQIPLDAHRALNDAIATHYLYRKLCEAFAGKEAEMPFQPTPLIYQVKRESPVTRAQVERIQSLVERHHITLEESVDALTRNEASRLIDKILAKYGR